MNAHRARELLTLAEKALEHGLRKTATDRDDFDPLAAAIFMREAAKLAIKDMQDAVRELASG